MDKGEELILVASSDPDRTGRCMLALEGAGYRVHPANDGTAVIASLTTQPAPDLILLSPIMSHVDGPEVIDWLKANPRFDSVPVVLFQHHAADYSLERQWLESACAGRADSWLWIPFTDEEVVAIVQRRLGGITGQLPSGYQPPWLNGELPPEPQAVRWARTRPRGPRHGARKRRY